MSIELQDRPAQSATALLDGILGDLQQLVQQQLALTRQEIAVELRQCVSAGVALSLAIGVSLISGIEFAIAASHLLHWWTQPTLRATETLPLWACHAIVAGGLAVIGGILCLVARSKYSCREICSRPAPETWQENAAWQTRRK